MQPPVPLARTIRTFFMIMIVIPTPEARIRRPGVDTWDEEFIMMIIRDRPDMKLAGT
jgi:hypothetical protein